MSPATNSTTFDSTKIKISGQYLDNGAFHRAIMIARAKLAHGEWDGQSEIWIDDPYKIYLEMERENWAMPQQSIIPSDHQALTPIERQPLDQNPAEVYLLSLAPGSRPTMKNALNTIAGIMGFAADFDQRGKPVQANKDYRYRRVPWGDLRYQHTAAIRARLAEQYKPTTANKMLSALRQVLSHARRLGYLTADDYNKAVDFKTVKGGNEQPAGRDLSSGELAALMGVCEDDPTPAGARDAAIIALMYQTGIRRASVTHLDLADYDPSTGNLIIRAAKGNKTYTGYVEDNGAQRALADWLAVRGDDPGPLFYAVLKGGHVRARRLSNQTIYDMLMKRAQQAGIDHFSPHDLRRTLAGDLLDAGTDIVTVQKMLGHASVTTTARYDRRPEEAKRKAAGLVHVPYRGRKQQVLPTT